MMGLVWAVVALAAAARSKEATFWMSWPDAYARGGGVGNQIEQLLGRVQCAMREGRPHHWLMVLPDLRSDRAKPPRRYRFEDVFDYGALRGVADVATWRDALDACGGRASVVEAGEAVAAGAVACRAMGAAIHPVAEVLQPGGVLVEQLPQLAALPVIPRQLLEGLA